MRSISVISLLVCSFAYANLLPPKSRTVAAGFTLVPAFVKGDEVLTPTLPKEATAWLLSERSTLVPLRRVATPKVGKRRWCCVGDGTGGSVWVLPQKAATEKRLLVLAGKGSASIASWSFPKVATGPTPSCAKDGSPGSTNVYGRSMELEGIAGQVFSYRWTRANDTTLNITGVNSKTNKCTVLYRNVYGDENSKPEGVGPVRDPLGTLTLRGDVNEQWVVFEQFTSPDYDLSLSVLAVKDGVIVPSAHTSSFGEAVCCGEADE